MTSRLAVYLDRYLSLVYLTLLCSSGCCCFYVRRSKH